MAMQCDVEHARLIDDRQAGLSRSSPSQRLRGLALSLASICGVCIGAFTIHRFNLTKTGAENANIEDKFEVDPIKHAGFAISQGNVMCEGEPRTDAVAANLEECEARCGDDCGWVVFHALPNTIVPTICKHFTTCSTTRPDANGHGRLMRKLPACLPAGRIHAQAGMVYRSVKGEKVGQPCLVEGINRYYVQAVSRVCLGIPLRGTAGNIAIGLHSSQLTCEKACDDDEKCNFYMWKDQPGTLNQYACNLYDGCNAFTKSLDGVGTIVFVKPRMLGNYQLILNNEYCQDNQGKQTELIHEASDQGPLKATSLTQCQSHCDDDPACHFYLYKDDKWAKVHRECITFRSCEKSVPFTRYGHSLVFRKLTPEEHKALQMEPVQTPMPPNLPAAPAPVPQSPAQPAPAPPAPAPPIPASSTPPPPVPVQPAPLPTAPPPIPATPAPAPPAPVEPVSTPPTAAPPAIAPLDPVPPVPSAPMVAPPIPVQPAPPPPTAAPTPQIAAPLVPALPAPAPLDPASPIQGLPTLAPPTPARPAPVQAAPAPPRIAAPTTPAPPAPAPPGSATRVVAPLAQVTPKAIERKCADVAILGTTWCKTSDWDCPRCALAQIRTFSSKATTLMHCALHCLTNSDCEAFNFPKPGDGFCYLKGSGKGCNKDASKNIGNFTCGRLDKRWDYYTLATHRTQINIPKLLRNIA